MKVEGWPGLQKFLWYEIIMLKNMLESISLVSSYHFSWVGVGQRVHGNRAEGDRSQAACECPPILKRRGEFKPLAQ